MSDPTEAFATPRIAAGALFVSGDRVLLVRKTYGNRWDIPGGYVDRGESPAAACQRELREELQLKRVPVRLLVQDWAPSDKEGDKILYVFDCGELGTDAADITLDGTELDHWQWVSVAELTEFVIPRLARRLTSAYQAHKAGGTLYLEHGEPALAVPSPGAHAGG